MKDLVYYLIYLLCFYYVIFAMKNSLHMLQINLYNENNRYLRWIFKNFKEIFNPFDAFSFLFSFILIFIHHEIVYYSLSTIIITFYIISYLKTINKLKKKQNKKPLVITKRIKRLLITIFIILFLPLIFHFIFKEYQITLCITLFLIMNIYFVIYLSNSINKPIEKLVFLHFKRKAKNKLHSLSNLKVIGITGSYGKTSCKNILNDVLKNEFNVLMSPKSINTLNGLMITINNTLSKFEDIFIAEMGAFVPGEIKNLCNLVGPKYGLITWIGVAHLETFKTEENILNTKMELIESLPEDGIGVLNKDDPKQKNYKVKNNCSLIWVGIDEKDVDYRGSNIKLTSEGSTFDIYFKKLKKKYSFKTKLLGKHNIYNILESVALASELNVEPEELIKQVEKIRPVEHRLELKKLSNFYQIDDAYNSNPVGAKNALQILNDFKGYKIVVTPGMIELGEKEAFYNKEFGKEIALVADQVILVGEKQTESILEGLRDKNYPQNKIKIMNDVKKTYPYISQIASERKENVYALYENDLPDDYNEN